MRPPQIGSLALLVYRECPCGDWIATSEGATAPICPHCGGRYVPGGGPREGEPMFGAGGQDARRIRGLGFVAFLTGEIAGVGLLRRLRGFLALSDEWGGVAERHEGAPRGDRHYYEDECRRASDEIAVAAAERAR